MITVIINTFFQEATHLTSKSPLRASNKRKQFRHKLTNACTYIHIS